MKTKTSFVAVLAFASLPVASLAQYFPVTPYLSIADSPFQSLSSSYFHVEDFQDTTLTPGLTAAGGRRAGPGPFADSVDADDGVIDGSGINGVSFFSDNLSSIMTFSFDAGVLGNFPTHAGVVWTDVGNTLSGPSGFGNVFFTAFDASGTSLGTLGPVSLGDGVATGGTAEDRFFGASNAGGISRIEISMPNSLDWEVDHVQYAYVPAPGTAGLLGLAGLLAGRRRR